MAADRSAHSEIPRSRNARKRRTWTRLAIAAVVVVAIISGAAAARMWRRAQQEEAARVAGLAAFERSEWDLALRELGVLLSRKTNDVEVLLAFATARMHVPMERGAHVAMVIYAIDRAREYGADETRCARLRLQTYVGGGMLAEAQREAERVLAIDERDYEARRVFVHASCARGRFEDAESVLRRAVKLEPSSLANRIALAEILVKRARAAALDRPPDRAASNAILEEVTSWAREPDAPFGVGELVHAVALELATHSREWLAMHVAGPEVAARTFEEAELRARLLDEIGRHDDGDALLTQLLQSKEPAGTERIEIARALFRRAIFSGDLLSARDLMAQEFANPSGESPSDLSIVYRMVLALVEGAARDEITDEAAWNSVSRETRAWLLRVKSFVGEEGAQSAREAGTIDVAAEAALRAAEAQRSLQAGKWSDALRRANDAVQLARGRFDAAEMIAIESLHGLGRNDEALVRSARLVDVSNGRPQARALRLLSESKFNATESLQRVRSPELRIADARAILSSHDATLRDSTVATLVLGSAGFADEARLSFTQCVDRARWNEKEAIALSESAVLLARALNDMSYLAIARSAIAREGDVSSEDYRWALAWMDALAAERDGDLARAWSTLCAAAPAMRQRLAIIGQFGDLHDIAEAPAMLRSSLPEGAAIVGGTRAVMNDPQLALETLTALKKSGDLRTIAVVGLRLATAHPSHFDSAEILAVAADARRGASRDAAGDVELLAAIAGFVLVTSPPDPTQALLLLDEAIRIAPADRKLREYAGYAALFAGDPQLASAHADSLGTKDPHGVVLRAAIAIAVGDGSRAEMELAQLKEGERDLPKFPGSDVASLRPLAAILRGDIERVHVDVLPLESVRVARMLSAEDHRALVLHCERQGADRVLIAHLAAEYLRRAMADEIAEIAQSTAMQLLDRSDIACVVAAYRAAVACGDAQLAERARVALSATASPRAIASLRREEAVAALVRDPTRSHAIATEILERFPDDAESALLVVASAVALGEVSARDAERLARLPKSPESYLIEARMALLTGREMEARRAARDGIELSARRAYVAFDTRDALRVISEMGASQAAVREGREADQRVVEARTTETSE